MSGRKLPKTVGYKRESKSSQMNSKFPDCIGRFPECKNYTADMDLKNRPECKFCPFNK
tara:strand:- start:395 stop:568 length:174 start_codon:yes stop_codon:yes gene_type:complete